MLPFLGKKYMFGAIIGCPVLYKLLAVPNAHAAIAKNSVSLNCQQHPLLLVVKLEWNLRWEN